MKKIYLLTLLVFSAAFASAQATNLIISEYGEGAGGNKKYFEIANNTGAAVNLANFQIWKSTNGAAWATGASNILSLTGTLANNDVYVVAHNVNDVPGADLYNSTFIAFNGNDGIGLAWNGGSGATFTLIDVVGEPVVISTGGWEVAGVANATVDKILVRKPTVCSPNTNWTTSRGTTTANSEWTIAVNLYNTVGQEATTLGSHTSSCSTPPCGTTNNMGAVSSCGTYTLNGTPYTTSGTYSQVLANANHAGCDSTINFTLTVKQPTVNNMTVSSCNSYTLNGTTYNTTGNYTQVLTGANSVGCDSTINLALTISSSITYYQDLDGDGFGNPAVTQVGCAPIVGYVTNGNDCNDNNPAIGVATVTYYQDLDGDTYGNPAVSQVACTQPTGYVTNNLDCNDNNAAITVAQNWYPDADGDTYGSASATAVVSCTQPANHVLNNTDCNDNNAAIHPGATEIPDNGIDEDCNGSDLNTLGAQLAQYVFTGNTCAAPALSVTAQPANAVFSDYMATADSLTCESGTNITNYSGWNTTSTLNPLEYYSFTVTPAECYKLQLTKLSFLHRISGTGGTPTVHIRSSLDNYAADVASVQIMSTGVNINENITLPAAFASVTSAVTFRFYVTNMGQSGSTYRHDDVSLSGFITALPTQTYYQDLDGDGFGNPAVTLTACAAPAGYVSDNTDCDDTNEDEFPGAIWYADADGDTFGNAAVSQVSCTQPVGYVSNNTDCNDNDAAITGQVAYYVDFDGDGFGESGSTAQMSCTPVTGSVTNDDDCDDTDDTVYPNAPELCDGKDNDCDGDTDEGLTMTTWYEDADGDGFGNADESVTDCEQPDGYVDNDEDCDDGNGLINPDANDIPNNGIDENCDGVDGYLSLDENIFGAVSVFPNPGTSAVTIKLTSVAKGATAQLISAEGKLISTQQVTGEETVINTENVLPGVYFVKISNASSATTVRWIKK